MSDLRPTWAGVTLLMVALLSGCGYHVAGKASRLPQSVHTIAIPAFVNQTQQYKVEQLLTQAVVREFVTRTQYRVVNEAQPDADATLRGFLTTVQISPVTFDSKTGRASTVLVTIGMRVTLVDRTGKAIFENQNYVFRDQYQVSRELSSFFQEEGPAVQRMSAQFARTLVSNVLEAF
jgi:outer membrane lipopolysaccharide assembly protein LptE/RlpB